MMAPNRRFWGHKIEAIIGKCQHIGLGVHMRVRKPNFPLGLIPAQTHLYGLRAIGALRMTPFLVVRKCGKVIGK